MRLADREQTESPFSHKRRKVRLARTMVIEGPIVRQLRTTISSGELNFKNTSELKNRLNYIGRANEALHVPG